jgi:outer membrane receptor for ferrienterochelin and colicins
MKNILNKYYLAFMALILCGNMYSQTQISGSVSDADSMDAIPGVNVIIDGTNIGTVTDFDGNFNISTSQELPLTIVVSYVGYSAERVNVTSANQNIDVSLSAGQNLEEIIISASRRAQKVTEAPASVSVISARQIENSPQAADPSRLLVSVPGVQIQQQTANTINFEMRAGSGTFGTSTYVMQDNRAIRTASAGTFFSFQQGLSNLDLASVEVVRGAAGVLYGPGVTSGVVHFRTKSPIDYDGVSASFWGGDLNTFGSELRIANSNDDKTFGWKINARINSGNDFVYEDEQYLADAGIPMNSVIRQPVITNKYVDPLLSLNGETLLDFGDGNAIIDTYSNTSINTTLEWRPSDETNYTISGGLNQGSGLFFQELGIGYTDGTSYWGQAQATMGNWYMQAFVDHNDGGQKENPTFLYGSGYRQVAKRTQIEANLQYNFDFPMIFDSEWTIGWDYKNDISDSEYTLYGRNDDDDEYVLNGIYGQGTLRMSDKVDLVLAGRYDMASFIGAGEFAPRAALVYKPSEKTTWRAAYNKALSGPGALQMYIDFPVAVLSPGVLDVWLSGQNNNHTFADPANQVIDLVNLFPIDLPVGSQLPLAIPYGSVAELAWAGLFAQAPSLQPLLAPWIAQYNAAGGPTAGTGGFRGYDVFEPSMSTGNRGTRGPQFTSVENIEVGVTSVIGDKLRVSADVYSYETVGFTNFNAVGDAYAFIGAANIPTDLGNAVAADATAYVTNALTQQLTAQYQGVAAQFGLPFSAVAAGALAGAGVPALQTAIAGGIAQTLGGINSAFQTGGQGFVSTVGAGFAALGAVESSLVPQGDNVTHVPAGYVTQGDAKRSHFGADFSVDYFANSDLRLWANTSWLSQNEWIPGEDNDDDLINTSYLNAPMWKYRLGVDYTPLSGINFAISFQHDNKFRSVQGFWNGMVETKNLIDASIGYRFSPKIRFDISATNLTDNKYRTYPNLPLIGRRVLGKLTVSL